MRFPLSWLKAWVELPSDLKTVQDLLMKSGIGLEAVDDPGAALRHVVVAKVLEKGPHPNADKLSLCKVDDGQRTYAVVCGAPNVAAGQTIALAKEGAILPGNFKIKKSKIRGQESEGMICSAQELGLKPDADGIWVLDSGLKLGQPLAEALGLDDPVLTLETTANRPDHLSIRGLARELAALGNLKLTPPEVQLPAASGDAGFSVGTAGEGVCSLYTARVIEGVKVGPAPAWMSARLEKSGIRSINNLVDVTNYVLLEMGQPLHAFDLVRLSGGKLEARLAKANEKMATLDGQERELTAEDVVIVDGTGPQALGGVMGGAHSQVTDGTTAIVLESACFPSVRIRRTSRRLGLLSESSLRFERGVDPHGVVEALDRAAALVIETAGGHLKGPVLKAGTEGPDPAAVEFDPARVNSLLGTRIDAKAMAELLSRRHFKVEEIGGRLRATPPKWRRDIRMEADLAEDLLQMAGLDTVASTNLPEVRTPDPDDPAWANAWMLRERLSALGLMEASTLTYLDPALAKAWSLEAEAPRLDNPFSEEQALLRPSLLPNLAAAAFGSLKRQGGGIAFFELGRAFRKGKAQVEEKERLAVLLCGERLSATWQEPARDWDYFDLKGLAEELAVRLGVVFRTQQAAPGEAPAWAHPGQAAKVSIGGQQGWMAALHPALLKALDAPREARSAFALELEPQSASKPLAKEPKYQAFPRVPAVERDISCLMDSALSAGKVLDFLRTEGGQGRVRVLDRFEGGPLPAGKKSLTFRLTYAAEGRSLTDEEVNKLHQDLVARLQTALAVEVRQ